MQATIAFLGAIDEVTPWSQVMRLARIYAAGGVPVDLPAVQDRDADHLWSSVRGRAR